MEGGHGTKVATILFLFLLGRSSAGFLIAGAKLSSIYMRYFQGGPLVLDFFLFFGTMWQTSGSFIFDSFSGEDKKVEY